MVTSLPSGVLRKSRIDPAATVLRFCTVSSFSSDRLVRPPRKGQAFLTPVDFNASIVADTTGMTIATNTTLLEITEQYPDTADRLVEVGFRKIGDPEVRARFGSSVSRLRTWTRRS